MHHLYNVPLKYYKVEYLCRNKILFLFFRGLQPAPVNVIEPLLKVQLQMRIPPSSHLLYQSSSRHHLLHGSPEHVPCLHEHLTLHSQHHSCAHLSLAPSLRNPAFSARSAATAAVKRACAGLHYASEKTIVPVVSERNAP